MSTAPHSPPREGLFRRVSSMVMAGCLGVMALSVFINVVLRYGFGSYAADPRAGGDLQRSDCLGRLAAGGGGHGQLFGGAALPHGAVAATGLFVCQRDLRDGRC